MDRLQLACYSLLASAAVILALIIFVAQDRFLPQAYAGNVLNRDDYTMLTATTSSSEEALFVIDSRSEKLLVYGVSKSSGGRLERIYVEDLARLFEATTDTTKPPKKMPR